MLGRDLTSITLIRVASMHPADGTQGLTANSARKHEELTTLHHLYLYIFVGH